MTNTLIRLVPAALAGVLVAGCATVPGDPYYYESPRYGVYEQPGYIYNNAPPVYVAPPVYRTPPAVYVPPPAVYYGSRDRNDWRDRDRAERDRADRERRDQHARDAAQRERAREQARRDQAERERRAAEDRRNRNNNPGARAPGYYGPHPQDWRARQYSNNPEPGAGP